MERVSNAIRRCAVYTRKSSDPCLYLWLEPIDHRKARPRKLNR
jgi:hypothetical protein